ncbi:hypothetical protein [Spirosoma sp. KUDC1026]|uniref:hypothetical protein n=1 Tax=Spirosoma sp. KUDC1026 TaxID=2745947 RepID=UPI00159B9D32|nr:hypothetical protein [Spirosoma sp. KUDC1026]QKZ13985.1 hypothetical protein HU175_15650 [Spirosoma sp. KUDC1026]
METLEIKPALAAVKRQQNKNEAVKVALLIVGFSSATIGTPSVQASRIRNDLSQITNGTYENFDHAALRIEAMERQLRDQNRRLSNVIKQDLPDEISLLPWETIRLLSDRGIVADFINRSDEGDLMIEFTKNSIEYSIEFLVNGEIVLLIKNGRKISAWDLDHNTFYNKIVEKLA